ncbi:MAG: hypothetical protein BWY36_00631 [Candidatus Diapherotrites archaeon ADurb.Bin253]|nr:MAG: hypothetical protein BWY36_00631 [Candidatus Diapherotrites archaeon ADurb.Bin253]HOT84881.1 hypothetical protein [Methanofastidiosum sp.]
MLEILWVLLLLTPIALFPTNYIKNSIKTKILFASLFYVLLYSTIGYIMHFSGIPITILYTSIFILAVDVSLLIYISKKKMLDKNSFKNDLSSIKFSKFDILLSLILVSSFFLFYYIQSRHYSLIAPDSWYWFSGLNYIKDTGTLFLETNVLNWYPDGFHYLFGITFLPFSATSSFGLVKLIGPLFGVLTIMGLWEYFKDKKIYLLIASILYAMSMPYLIIRFSMFVPEAIGIFFIIATALILKDYELTKNNIIIIAIIFGLLTNIYHFIGPILFICVVPIIMIKKVKEIPLYFISYCLASIFFIYPYLVNYSGLLVYQEHIVDVQYYPQVWLNSIYASGIVFFAKPGIRESVIGFPLAILYPLILLKKNYRKNDIMFGSLIIAFSLCLGVSYLFYKNGLALRYKSIFAIGSAILFPQFIEFLRDLSKKILKNKFSKWIIIFVILILANRALIDLFAFPEIEMANVKTEDSKMILWIDDNIPNDTTIILGDNVFSNQLGLTKESVLVLLYPRNIVKEIGFDTSGKTCYKLGYFDSNNIVHQENDLFLIRCDADETK